MPIIGYVIAHTFAHQIEAFDHWIAFGLLVFIGGKMLWEVIRGGEDETAPKGDPHPTGKISWLWPSPPASTPWRSELPWALSGRTGLLEPAYGFLFCSLVIALVTFVLCLAGVQIGCKTGDRYGKKAEIAGGIVLIGMDQDSAGASAGVLTESRRTPKFTISSGPRPGIASRWIEFYNKRPGTVVPGRFLIL